MVEGRERPGVEAEGRQLGIVNIVYRRWDEGGFYIAEESTNRSSRRWRS